jgi:SWI/SNF-related matrix-associated actin-dependent regulator of chromatin subfamily A member 5
VSPILPRHSTSDLYINGSPPKDWEKHLERIEAGEKQREKRHREMSVLRAKVDGIDHPMQKLAIPYGQNKGKQYSEEEDRFLLVRLCKWGIHNENAWDLIKRDIGEWPAFRLVVHLLAQRAAV